MQLSFLYARIALVLLLGATLEASIAANEAPERPPAQMYANLCAQCHEHGNVPRAPHSIEFPMIGPAQILTALESGVMQPQGTLLTPVERRSIAEFLGGAKLPDMTIALERCDAERARFDVDRPPPLAGWGMTPENTRYIAPDIAQLPVSEIPRLKLKWAFGFDGATRARSQPTVGGGALYVGSQDGTVYSLDFETGCVRWTFRSDSEVRSSPVLESWRRGDRNAKPRLFIGDFNGNAYALDARTGALLWKTRVDEHPRLTLTGSPRLHDGRLYVPMSSSEWAAAADPSYECCTFRGGVAALDIGDGKVLWRGYSIPETPKALPAGNAVGVTRYHAAGAPVWNSPTIDTARRRIYVGTGEGYTSPAAPQTDAVVAFDLATGGMLWWHQSLAQDAWTMACLIGGPNCPEENGPDFDIGAATILYRRAGGQDIVLAGQKSGHVLAVDAESGRLLWKRRFGRGGLSGGVHWGMALGDGLLYAPMADTTVLGTEQGEPEPGLNAIDPVTGKLRWFAPAPDVCSETTKPSCDPGYSAPVTAIAGAVFAPSYDGHLRAYAARDGRLLWDVDTTSEVITVSGTRARGGSIESVGPIVVEGKLVVPSGYLFGNRMPGNVLLVYSVDGR